MAQESIAVRKVTDLNAATRRWVESLFGRRLDEQEEVAVMVFPARAAPSQAARRKAAARMDRLLDKAARAMKDVPDQEFEAAVDEAMEHARQREK